MTVTFAKINSFKGNHSDSSLGYDRPCPVCGNDKCKPVMSIPDLQYYSDSAETPKRFDLINVQCTECNTLYLRNAFSDKGFECLFAEAGQSYGDGGGRADEQVGWMRERGLLADGYAIMDIGCYEGRFLRALPGSGPRIGIDYDQGAIDRATNLSPKGNFSYIQGKFETFAYDKKVDVFTMFHVLEHLTDPLTVLKKLRSLAHENTRLVVEIPIVDHLLTTNDIHGFFSPQHLTHFTSTTLAMALERTGWILEEGFSQSDYNGYRIMAKAGKEAQSIEPTEKDHAALSLVLRKWDEARTAANVKINNLPQNSKIILWGGGMHSETLYHQTTFFKRFADSQFAIIDSDKTKQGKTWRGIKIHDPDTLKGQNWEEAIIFVSSYGSQYRIKDAALALGVPEGNLFLCYDSIQSY